MQDAILENLQDEVATILIGDGSENAARRDIVLRTSLEGLQYINELHPSYMPLQYPLLFPRGEDANNTENGKVTQAEFFGFRMQNRTRKSQSLLRGGRLLQQYIVDTWASLEQNRLQYLRHNQAKLRAEVYQGIQDAANASDHDAAMLGCRIVLPSSFQGGARLMMQNYQDPDLIVRAFHLRLAELKRDLFDVRVLGACVAHVYTIEFQKQGFPHVHILMWIHKDAVPRTATDVDRVICAEISNETTDPLLYATVTSSMMHGPCGRANPNAPCCKETSECAKKFSKPFTDVTKTETDGYPVYRRRGDGQTVVVKDVELDDRYVKFNAHINVEVYSHMTTIKYLFKYVYKGPNRATVEIASAAAQNGSDEAGHNEQVDEIKQYLDARYVSTSEGAWRLFKTPMHDHSPAIERLPVHLPNQQLAIYKDTDNIQEIANRAAAKKTPLTEWFEANLKSPDLAKALTYVEFSQEFTWKTNRPLGPRWEPRERYYLRMLLNTVRGVTSWEDLLTVNGHVCHSFKETCLTDPRALWDQHYTALSNDIMHHIAASSVSRRSHQQVSVVDVLNETLHDLDRILQRNSTSLSNFPSLPQADGGSILALQPNRLIHEEQEYDMDNAQAFVEAAQPQMNAKQREVYDSMLQAVEEKQGGVFFVNGCAGARKTFLYRAILARIPSSGIVALLLDGKRTAHSRFRIPVNCEVESACFIRTNYALAELLRKTSAIIWDEAPTCHRFTVEVLDRTLQDVMKSDQPFEGIVVVLGGDFRQTLPVIPKGKREDIVGATLPRSHLWLHVTFTNLIDNMQLRNMNADDTERQSAIEFVEWVLALGNGTLPNFTPADYDNSIGDDWIKLPTDLLLPSNENTLEKLITFVYGNTLSAPPPGFLIDHAILTPKNDDVTAVNEKMLALANGEKHEYLSVDIVANEDQVMRPNHHDIRPDQDNNAYLYPPEFLRSINPTGFPPHRLCLKVGAPIIMLRNLNQAKGLCNGTRLIVRKLGARVLEAEIISGDNVDTVVMIPRIVLRTGENDLYFCFQRRQFPVRLAYAMTINKSQGQTMKRVGIYLPRPGVFGHGQLYVAVSRVSSRDGLKLLVDNSTHAKAAELVGCTRNVVHREVFPSF
ncbi:hypothetical protein BDL97_11G053400 [Sphagnum fallax]|nr:hypothetical protein BDL97_11G053400 [Sphagnum fallax]